MERFQHAGITEKIIGAAMRVHRSFGLGFPEVIYRRALTVELEELGLSYEVEVEREIRYKNQLLGKRRLDLIVENVILVELKAINELDKKCFNQIINYLNVFKLDIGLLVNFGTESLQFKRLFNSKNNLRNPLKP